MSILFLLATVPLIASWILSPLIREEPEEGMQVPPGDTLAELQLAKERAYESIRDADFDFHTGKLSEPDYRSLRRQFQEEALVALRKLEEHRGDQKSAPRKGSEGR